MNLEEHWNLNLGKNHLDVHRIVEKRRVTGKIVKYNKCHWFSRLLKWTRGWRGK